MNELNQAKPVLIAAALALLWTLETVLPQFTGRQRRLSHYGHNLALGLLNAAVVAVVFAAALVAAAEWSAATGFGLLHQLQAPAWVAWPLAILLLDLWMYLWHRLNHKVPLLWRLHSVHHSDAEMDASSASRFHTGEIVLSSLARLVILPVLGVTPLQLLGYELLLQPVILFHHSNVRLPAKLDQVLRTVIVTPWMHWVHHSRYQPETDSNFASVFSWWDRLFGSFRLRGDPSTISLGLDGYEQHEWRSLDGMLRSPFRARSAPPAATSTTLIQRIALGGLSLAFIAAGANHFVSPDFYLQMMPPYLPAHRELVILSGVLEIVGGIGVLVPRLRSAAGWGLVLLLLAVFPANLHMALHPELFPDLGAVALYARLPFQAVFIAWAYWATRPVRTRSAA